MTVISHSNNRTNTLQTNIQFPPPNMSGNSHPRQERPINWDPADFRRTFDRLNSGTTLEHHTVSFRPLIDFLKYHTSYLPTSVPHPDHECPICRESASESHERIIQVNLLDCHHIFGATCFERYIQRSHTCPMCRAQWFERRLVSETMPDITREIRIEVVVANNGSADRLLAALASQPEELTHAILGGQVIELGSDDEDHSDGNGSSDASSATHSSLPGSDTEIRSNWEETVEAGVEIQQAAAVEEAQGGVETESEDSSDDAEGDSGVVRREIEGSMEIGDENVALGSIGWSREARRTASDDEVDGPPRQRRRFG